MEFDRKEFRKKFPNLYRELEEPVEEGSPHTGKQDTEGSPLNESAPQITSYIRRARTIDEALEVIGYLKRRGEISESQAMEFRRQIEEKGVRSFGPLRTWGHYERELRGKPSAKLDDVDEDEQEEVD